MLSLIVPLAIAFLAVRAIARARSPTAEERGYLDTLLAAPLARRTLVAGAFVVAALVVADVLAVITADDLGWRARSSGADPSLVVLGREASRTSGRWRCCSPGSPCSPPGVLHRAASGHGDRRGDARGDVRRSTSSASSPTAIEPLRFASAFKYYGSAIQDGIDPLAFAGLTLVAAALAAVGALLFEHRDVR